MKNSIELFLLISLTKFAGLQRRTSAICSLWPKVCEHEGCQFSFIKIKDALRHNLTSPKGVEAAVVNLNLKH